MTELLEKDECLALRIPSELKARLAQLNNRLLADVHERHRVAPGYSRSISATARAALETGIEAIEQALKNGHQNTPCQNPRKKRG